MLNTTLKSGTSQLRGSVWEFHRNDALNASDFFANRAGLKKGDYLSNQFGFTAGGPAIGTQDVLVRRLRGQPDQAGADLGENGADGAAAIQRVHRLLGPHLAAERKHRRRRPGPDVSARGTVFDPATTRQVQAGQVDPVTGMVAHPEQLRAGSVRRQPDSSEAVSTPMP